MSTALTAARVALLRRLASTAEGRLHSTRLHTTTKGLVTRMTNDQPDQRWIDRVWDERGDGYTLSIEPAGRAALQDAEAGDGE